MGNPQVEPVHLLLALLQQTDGHYLAAAFEPGRRGTWTGCAPRRRCCSGSLPADPRLRGHPSGWFPPAPCGAPNTA